MTTFDHLIGKQLESGSYTWDAHRTMLYAVGVGAGLADPYEELQFTTENTEGVTQQVIPSFIALMSQSSDWIRELGFKAREWDGMEWGWPEGMVHGDQGITLARPIPVSGTVNLTQTLLGVFDKGSGALAIAETRSTLADTGELLGTSRAGMFVRGQGGFGGPRAPADEKPWPKPDRAPDLTVSIEVPIGQSLIYRLLGDVNPHATDPARASGDGFSKPIFFGLGTYGFACRALLKGLCDGDVARFGAMDARFSQPVHPGDRLDTQIWRNHGGAQFLTTVGEGRVVIDRGLFRFAGEGLDA
jgi:acyl dehydratase